MAVSGVLMPACLLPEKSMRRRLIVLFHPRVVPSRQPLIEMKVFPTSLYLASLGSIFLNAPG